MIGAYDKWILMPTVDLYDTLMMLAAVLAAKDMYNRSEQRIKEFNEKYGDFTTPIIADQDWYNQEFGGKIHRYIDDIYRRGGDPLRNAQDRASMMMMINSLPYGDYAKIRTSAENAREYLRERSKLEAAGLYNPLLEKYAGKGMDTFSTLGGDGIWDRMSPTPYQDMATFSKAYFDNIQPFQRSATKNGISYTISEINMDDLHRIADAHFNDLVLTPQGQLMYKMLLEQNNGDAVAARLDFNNAVVSGNTDRLRYADNYDERDYLMKNLAIKQLNLALRRAIAAGRQRASKSDNGGPGTELQGISLAQSWYDTAMANAYSKTSGFTKDWNQMHNMYGDFSRDAGKLFHDFGSKFINNKINPTNADLLSTVTRDLDRKTLLGALDTPENKRNANQKGIIDVAINKWRESHKPNLENIRKLYQQLFTIPMDGKSVAEIIGTPFSENKMVAKIGEGAIDKLYGVDDMISNTAGYTKAHTAKDTKRIRDAIKKWGVNNTTVTSMERGYGSLRKSTGSFEVNPEVKIVCTDDDGNVQFVGYGYYDIGLGSNSTKGGAYLGDYKTTGGAKLYGSMTETRIPHNIGVYLPSNDSEATSARYVPGFRGLVENTTNLNWTPEQVAGETNMFPDYNRWTAFGVWDTDLTSKRLHAKASESLGTYGNVYSDDDLDNILFSEDEE